VADYETGEQPCSAFRAEMTGNEYGMWENVHECVFCPAGKATVSFCENCSRDHHDGGYETCKRIKERSAAPDPLR